MACLPLSSRLLLALAGCGLATAALASSHREAPFITTAPKVDGTDFYMFRSYEGVAANGIGGRSEFVTLIANYLPLQDAYGGPNYFALDPNALYEIHVDHNGDAREDLTFQFRFENTLRPNPGRPTAGTELQIGDRRVNIPILQSGPISGPNAATLQLLETYTVTLVRGDRRTGSRAALSRTGDGATRLEKPLDHVGDKTFPNYAAYADQHVHSVNIPGCSQPGRVFVGQRKESFAVNLGPIFDLVNAPVSVITNPGLINAAAANSIQDKNVTTLALEVHRSCLTQGNESVIGGWTTASLRQARVLNGAPPSGHQTSEKVGGAWTQVSRLGNPLVNEVVIGLRDKDRFNASRPRDDLQFANYVTHPTLPVLLGVALLGDANAVAPTNLPRTDLLNVFLTGLGGVNRPANVVPSEMLRLNTALPPVPFARQNRLGIAGEALAKGGVEALLASPDKDLAGFPNGRRPKDDVVDIALVAVAGGLCVLNDLRGGQVVAGANVLGLNSFTIPGSTPITLSSACRAGSVPLGATSAALHDGVDQAAVGFLDRFPYLDTPRPGARSTAATAAR